MLQFARQDQVLADINKWENKLLKIQSVLYDAEEKYGTNVDIWQKPLTNDCYMERALGTQPPLCRSDDDPYAAWGVPMEACITPYTDRECLLLVWLVLILVFPS